MFARGKRLGSWRRIWRRTLGILAVAALIAAPRARAEEPSALPPAWACLPEGTIAVMRLPNVASFVDAAVENTRLGAAISGGDRWKAALELLARKHGTDLETVEKRLEAYDLKLADWRMLLSGECGYAAIAEGAVAGTSPRGALDWDLTLSFLFASWCEPDDELADRLWKAWDRWTAKAAESGLIKRVDESLVGVPVIRVTAGGATLPHGTLSFGGGFTGRGLSLEMVIREEKKSDGKTSAKQWTDFHLLTARVGRRLLVVHDMPGKCEEADNPQARSAESLESCRKVMGPWLERHQRPQEGSAWLRDAIGHTPREGAPLFELHANARPVIQAELDGMQAELTGEESKAIRSFLEFIRDSLALQTISMRCGLQENRWERTIRVGVPKDRRAALSLFDAGSLPVEPAAWVPKSAASYSQINLDATSLMDRLRPILQEMRSDPDVGPALTLFESQWHLDLAELIAGLGPRMMFVEFADPPEGQKRIGPADAILWQVRNDEQWQKLFEGIAGSFGLDTIKRDGYLGMQVPLLGGSSNAKLNPWLLAGHGHLVFASGEDPTGPPLANLPEARAGGETYRDSRAFKRAAELFRGDACFAFQCIDVSSPDETARWLRHWLGEAAKLQLISKSDASGTSTEGPTGGQRSWRQRLLGDDADKALITLEADRLTVEPDALVHRTILEFVPPER